MSKKIDMTGEKYGKLKVLQQSGVDSRGEKRWLCKCDCGNETFVGGYNLRNGSVKSCGCEKPRLSHGKTHSKTYTTWQKMKARCTNPNDDRYYLYGRKGITICERWKSFENFLNDMGEKPEETTLDRIDNSKGYEPLNCRWASREQQQRNTNAKGVYYKPELNKWVAAVNVGRKYIHLGCFETREEAREAYLEGKERYHDPGDTRPEVVKRLHKCWDRFYSEVQNG